MKKRQIKLLVLSVIGLFLFHQPVLDMILKPNYVFGIPQSILYIFLMWLVFILALFKLARLITKSNPHD